MDVRVRQLRAKHGEDAAPGVADLHAHRLHRRGRADAVGQALLVHSLGHQVRQPARWEGEKTARSCAVSSSSGPSPRRSERVVVGGGRPGRAARAARHWKQLRHLGVPSFSPCFSFSHSCVALQRRQKRFPLRSARALRRRSLSV